MLVLLTESPMWMLMDWRRPGNVCNKKPEWCKVINPDGTCKVSFWATMCLANTRKCTALLNKCVTSVLLWIAACNSIPYYALYICIHVFIFQHWCMPASLVTWVLLSKDCILGLPATTMKCRELRSLYAFIRSHTHSGRGWRSIFSTPGPILMVLIWIW